MTDPAEIAATLTEVEKRCLSGWQGVAGAAYNVVSTGLQKKGLLRIDWSLTVLGRSVCDHLLSEQEAKPEPAREFCVGDRVRHVNAPVESTMIVSAADDGAGYVICRSAVKNHTVTQEWRVNDLILAPDPAAETFFAPDYVTPVGEPVEPDNPRAFPSAAIDDRYGGMTLRDWFAGQALAGIGAWAPNNPDGTAPSDPKAMRVKYCYEMADAMLAERGKS